MGWFDRLAERWQNHKQSRVQQKQERNLASRQQDTTYRSGGGDPRPARSVRDMAMYGYHY